MAVLSLTATVRNNMLNVIRDAVDAGVGAGTLKFYTGTKPANADAGLSGNTLLGTLTFSNPSAANASGGTLTFNSITQDSSADNTGTATWARIANGSGGTVFDVDVTATGGGGAITINTTAIVAGGPIQVTGATITLAG